jgi:2-keto-3-deoxy-L-rhamnonate aldolase RhmA
VSRRRRVGTVLTIPDVTLAELLGEASDLVWIDLEHGALTCADVPPLAVGLRAARCEAHVRLPSWRSEMLPPALDAGVDGIVAPAIERAEDAAALVRRLRYPPAGERGFGPRRAGGYGRDPLGVVAPACAVQIESAAAVAAAPAIAAVDGVGTLVIGCADLGLALGGQPGILSPALRDAAARVHAAARAAGKAFGVAGAADAATLSALAAGDVDVVVHSVDVRIYAGAVDHAMELASGAFAAGAEGRVP